MKQSKADELVKVLIEETRSSRLNWNVTKKEKIDKIETTLGDWDIGLLYKKPNSPRNFYELFVNKFLRPGFEYSYSRVFMGEDEFALYDELFKLVCHISRECDYDKIEKILNDVFSEDTHKPETMPIFNCKKALHLKTDNTYIRLSDDLINANNGCEGEPPSVLYTKDGQLFFRSSSEFSQKFKLKSF